MGDKVLAHQDVRRAIQEFRLRLLHPREQRRCLGGPGFLPGDCARSRRCAIGVPLLDHSSRACIKGLDGDEGICLAIQKIETIAMPGCSDCLDCIGALAGFGYRLCDESHNVRPKPLYVTLDHSGRRELRTGFTVPACKFAPGLVKQDCLYSGVTGIDA
jgi:hypothetical protein